MYVTKPARTQRGQTTTRCNASATFARNFWRAAATLALLMSGSMAAAYTPVGPQPVTPGPAALEPLVRRRDGAYARRLAEAASQAKADNATSSIGISSINGDVNLTPKQLDALVRNWQSRESYVFPDLFQKTPSLVWGPVNLTLFGADSHALRGGVAGATSVIAFCEAGDDSPIAAACATFAARFPHLLPLRFRQDGDKVTVNLQVKTRPEAGGFTELPVTINATLPVVNGTGALATQDPAADATWSLYAVKALVTLSTQENSSYYLQNFQPALQALLGREIDDQSLVRSGDIEHFTKCKPKIGCPEDGLPSRHFNAWMQRLGDQQFGGLTFHQGFRLTETLAYDSERQAAIYPDGNVTAILGGFGVRLRAPMLDAVIIGARTYAVISVNRLNPAGTQGFAQPVSVTLMLGTGLTYDGADAVAWESHPFSYINNHTLSRGTITLPVEWVKRTADMGYTA